VRVRAFPGCTMVTRAVGPFKMADEKGPDDHVVCPRDDPGRNEVRDVTDLPAQLWAEISHSVSVYKDLDPTPHSEVRGWGDPEAAIAALGDARERFGAPG
jgi:inorganic pyrophosphatase